MAKSKSKETSTPLICALVFFILTTIAFGVMWYLAYADMEAKNAEVKKAKDDQASARNLARDAELKARVYRAYLGTEIEGVTDDKTVLAAEAKPDDVIAKELDNIHKGMAKTLGVADVASLPDELKKWTLDSSRKAPPPPAEGVVNEIAKLKNAADTAIKTAQDERKAYADQISFMKQGINSLKASQDRFTAEVNKLPADIKAKLKTLTDDVDNRIAQLKNAEEAANKRVSQLTEETAGYKSRADTLEKKLKDSQKEGLDLLGQLNIAQGKGELAYDEPQGKILRKLPEGVVEINLGSAVGVKPGLTFTVLPPDFPEKGKRSRMRTLRVPDSRGEYKSVEAFVTKGSLEVYEVVGPNLSLARIQAGSELDPIRDGVTVGDLIYNAAWRKGVADHVALIGIFDINGDGTDDIETVIRDFKKIGIPVDAYYDLKKRAWVGEVTERTRYLVEGYRPIPSATGANLEEKSKLLKAIDTSVDESRRKGVAVINFREFFSRMGYKYRLDVTEDKINQATAPYLSNVGIGQPLTPPNSDK